MFDQAFLFLGVGNPRHPYYQSVFEVGFVHENPLKKWYSQSTDWCLNMLEKLESTDLDEVVGFKDVIFTDQSTVTINGDVVFEKGFVTDSLRTTKVRIVLYYRSLTLYTTIKQICRDMGSQIE